MNPERWRKVEELFHGALDRPEAERKAWLEKSCAGDSELLKEVDSLLASEQSATAPSIQEQVASAVKQTAKTLEQGTLPRTVGPYRLLKQIGRGGMGTVYLAERADGHFEKQVAVKMVQPGLDTEFILARFRRERQVLARFDHPNIGRLLDGGTAPDGTPYLVMEYIDGDWINRYCESKNLSVEERLRLFLRVCSAVHYAHLHFVVHRDLKPGNILVDAKGHPKLLDFGICKLLYREASDPNCTGTLGLRLLTPEYASPEQVCGEPITIASDVYSLGAVLYELLTGARPHLFPKLTPQVVEQVVCEQDIVPPSQVLRDKNEKLASRLRGDIDNIILHAMSKEPARRYETVEQFANDIRKHLSDKPILARADTFVYRSRKFVRRNRLWLATAAALIVAFLAGLSIHQSSVESRNLAANAPATLSAQHALSQKQRLAMLVELGDSYATDENWKGALDVYEQAWNQLPGDASRDDPEQGSWRTHLGENIRRARERQNISPKK